MENDPSRHPAWSYIGLLVGAICLWNIVQGFRSGTMRCGFGSMAIDRDRWTKPAAFWTCGAFNAIVVALCFLLIVAP